MNFTSKVIWLTGASSGIGKALALELAKAKALIFPQEEDFGITPLEANASGTPVIAYGAAGVIETMIPLGKPNPTSVFFESQTEEDLIKAIEEFEQNESQFSTEVMVNNAYRFREEKFSNRIIEYVNEKIPCT